MDVNDRPNGRAGLAEAEAVASPATVTPTPPLTAPAPPQGRPRTRRRAFALLGLVLVVAVIAYLVWLFFFTAPSEATDDAYVAGDVVSITAREAGTVIAIHADTTERVRRGQPLLDLDPATSNANLAAAEAQLAQAVRGVRSSFAQVDAAEAEIVQARAELARARDDLGRRQGAAREGAVSGEEVAHAADAVRTAQASLDLALSRRAQAQSAVSGTRVETNPDVLAAIAAVRRAAITGSHMHLTAPVDGVVAQRAVQLGQQVTAGTPLMAVVPLERVWVDANFRETQLADLRVGQPVRITTDVYGGDVVFHGHVLGLGAGSGNAFALLPPQNASGNWIKIVQRVPVRIALDPRELQRNPLRVGLSVDVTVNTADHSGAPVARAAAGTIAHEESQTGGADVDALINRIIAQNRGGGR